MSVCRRSQALPSRNCFELGMAYHLPIRGTLGRPEGKHTPGKQKARCVMDGHSRLDGSSGFSEFDVIDALLWQSIDGWEDSERR
jgi:hypothetical protein